MSRSNPVRTGGDDAFGDPSRTLTDLPNNDSGKGMAMDGIVNGNSNGNGLPAESTLGKVESEKVKSEKVEKGPVGTVIKPEANVLKDLPAARKSVLLLCFCLAMFSESRYLRSALIFSR